MKQETKQLVQQTAVRIGYGLDYPVDALLDVPSVRVVGNGLVIVEGCRGLIDYVGNRITVDLGDLVAAVYGSELVMESLTRGALNITGRISSITFDKRTG